ncbi:MAG: hypothetical protein WB819_09625, partial [Terriglobia bacterium]
SRCLQNMVTVRNCSAAVPAALFKAGKMPALRKSAGVVETFRWNVSWLAQTSVLNVCVQRC